MLCGTQFDFARLETEPLNLFVRQNSFEPEDFICQGAIVEHLNLCLFVRVGRSCEQWPTTIIGRVNRDQLAHWSHRSGRRSLSLPSPLEQTQRAEAGGEERERAGEWSGQRHQFNRRVEANAKAGLDPAQSANVCRNNSSQPGGMTRGTPMPLVLVVRSPLASYENVRSDAPKVRSLNGESATNWISCWPRPR